MISLALCLSQNSTLDGSPSISAFMNFNSSFKQQYPHLLHRQQSQSPISYDPLTSLGTQQDFLSLPTIGLLKNDKMPSTDQEKLNDVISQTRRWVKESRACVRRYLAARNHNKLDGWDLMSSFFTFSRRRSISGIAIMCSWHETKCHFIAFLCFSFSVSTICWSTTHLTWWTHLIIAQDQTNRAQMSWTTMTRTTKEVMTGRSRTVQMEPTSTAKLSWWRSWSKSIYCTKPTPKYSAIFTKRKVSGWLKTSLYSKSQSGFVRQFALKCF